MYRSRFSVVPWIIASILLLPLLAGCQDRPDAATNADEDAEARRTLTVYARVTDVSREVEMALIEAFEENHNVSVNLVSGEDPDLYAKFVVEKENGLETADLLAGWNPTGILDLQERGWLEAYVPPSLKDRIPERFRDPIVIRHTGLVTLAYNPEKLGDTPPPTAFADLTDDAYAGRVEMPDPIVSNTALSLVTYLAYSTPLGWEYWEKLHANGLRQVGDWGQLIEDLTDPNSPVAVVIAGYGRAYPAMLEGEPLEVVVPEEGLLAGEYAVAIRPDSPRADLARAYVEEVIFHPDMLDVWAQRYLPVTVGGLDVPEGTPAFEDIVLTDWRLTQEKELETKTQWQIVQSQ